jgi:hypothetical protein
MAADSAELDGVEPAEPDDPDRLEVRTSQLVADLVEPAKSTALEKLGEGRPAFDIANAWLRAKFGVAAGGEPLTGSGRAGQAGHASGSCPGTRPAPWLPLSPFMGYESVTSTGLLPKRRWGASCGPWRPVHPSRRSS